MNIIVCVKPVPDPDKYNLLTIDPETKRLVREGIPTVINPSDKNALEEALRLKDLYGAKVSVISMTPLFSVDKIKQCLAMGADEGFVISDRAFGGADTFSTSYTLMKAIEEIGTPDLILAGNESADGATSHVPVQLAEWMSLPHITNVTVTEAFETKLHVRKKTEEGSVDYEIDLPAVLAVERNSNQPRMVTAKGMVAARSKSIRVFAKDDLDVDESLIGLCGSPTQPGELIVPNLKRASQELKGEPEEIAAQIITLIKKSGVAVAV
ncbi:MAG: electron transfer flavoprotein beta subunit/FixA family protein [Bacillota bacterium]|nr:electron transfer flavoprotein beta subunit/FixA family protein [Bacillota bacterium]